MLRSIQRRLFPAKPGTAVTSDTSGPWDACADQCILGSEVLHPVGPEVLCFPLWELPRNVHDLFLWSLFCLILYVQRESEARLPHSLLCVELTHCPELPAGGRRSVERVDGHKELFISDTRQCRSRDTNASPGSAGAKPGAEVGSPASLFPTLPKVWNQSSLAHSQGPWKKDWTSFSTAHPPCPFHPLTDLLTAERNPACPCSSCLRSLCRYQETPVFIFNHLKLTIIQGPA